MHRSLVLTGVVLMLVGVGALVGSTALATIVYPQNFFYSMKPSGSQSNPEQLTPEAALTLSVSLIYQDPTLGISLPDPRRWTVYCFVRRPGIEAWSINLGAPKKFTVGYVSSRQVYIAIWEASWKVPVTEDATYEFKWFARIIDSTGATLSETSALTYGATPKALGDGDGGTTDGGEAHPPDGYFTINGQKAETTSTVITWDGGLTIKFIVTDQGLSDGSSRITSVYVMSKFGIGTQPITKRVDLEKLTETEWTAAYKLPEKGTYELTGYFQWVGSTDPILKMSVVATYDEQVKEEPQEETTDETTILLDKLNLAGVVKNKLELAGLVSAGIGTVLVLAGIVAGPRKK